MTDKETYIKSLQGIVKNLNSSINSADSDIVIALSRKGPRLLEYLRKNMGLKELNVMTEHALPFLFDRILAKSDQEYRIFIVDDAIYYGSTISALKDEIESYIAVYGLKERVHIEGIYSCIKDKESLDFGDVEVKAIKNVRLGYGHFFVKEVMKDLRSLGKSLEVEFPEICYETKSPVDIYKLLASLESVFGSEKVYMIDSPIGIKSISVLLSDVKNSTFRKLRIFVDGCKISIVSIAPELMQTNLGLFRFISFGNIVQVNALWREMAKQLEGISEKLWSQKMNDRNLVRTAVVLFNYFSSVDTFCYFRRSVECAILNTDGEIVHRNIDSSNLVYLLGSETIADEIVSAWNEALDSEQYYILPISDDIENIYDNIVFESSRLSSMEANLLKATNLKMVFDSKTMKEALSAMFFNQTMMIERGSRYISVNRQDRLRFGYTFQYLWNFIWDNANNIETKGISAKEMHQWIDIQIDNGSIVPQYILGTGNFKWVRVFRSGENEDVLLSHIGRFVVHVIGQMLLGDVNESSDKVIKKNLNGVLAAVFHRFRKDLEQEEFVLPIELDSKEWSLNILLEDCVAKKNISENLVDFLASKNVLTIQDDKFVCVASQVQGKEFVKNTTLSSEVETAMDGYIKDIMAKMGNKPQASFIYSNTINYFMSDIMDVRDVCKKLQNVSDTIYQVLPTLFDRGVEREKIDRKLRDLLDKYREVLSRYEMNSSVLLDETSMVREELRPYMWKVWQMVNVLNILVSLFYKGREYVITYINDLSDTLKKYLVADDLFTFLMSQENANKDLWHDKIFKFKIQGYINNVILNFNF